MKLNEMHPLNRNPRITKEILQPLTQQDNVSRDLFPEPAGPSYCLHALIPAPQVTTAFPEGFKSKQSFPREFRTPSCWMLSSLGHQDGAASYQTLLTVSAPNRMGFIRESDSSSEC